MRYQSSLVYLLILLFLPVLIPAANAQTVTTDPEYVYDSIRVIAFNGQLREAESLAHELVDANPHYGDAIVLLARIIAWQERYPEAVMILDTLLAEQPEHLDALEARTEIVGWMKSKEESDADTIENAKVETHTADTILAEINVDESEPIADTTGKDIEFHLGYSFDTFKEPYKRFWQIFSMGVLYPTKAGPILGTVNFGNIHADNNQAYVKTGMQVQAEMWPVISEKSYAWLAYAYSPFEYFPKHRASAEYWYNLLNGWVLSAGASYYYFDNNIFIPAFSVEKYLGKYWFSAKTYIHLKDAGTTASVYLTARRYSNDYNYLQLTLGVGTAPDEPYDIATDLERQSAIAVKMAFNRRLNSNISIRAGAGYSREEYQENLKRNRFEGFVTLIYGKPKR